MDHSVKQICEMIASAGLKLKQKELCRILRLIHLKASGISQQSVARKLDVTYQAVNNELRGEFRSEKIRLGICDMTGISKDVFWPEFYPLENVACCDHTVPPQNFEKILPQTGA